MKWYFYTCSASAIPVLMSSSITASQMRSPLKKSLLPSYVNDSAVPVRGIRTVNSVQVQKLIIIGKLAEFLPYFIRKRKKNQNSYLVFTLCIPWKWCSVAVPYNSFVPVVEIWSHHPIKSVRKTDGAGRTTSKPIQSLFMFNEFIQIVAALVQTNISAWKTKANYRVLSKKK